MYAIKLPPSPQFDKPWIRAGILPNFSARMSRGSSNDSLRKIADSIRIEISPPPTSKVSEVYDCNPEQKVTDSAFEVSNKAS